jgi:hypothetical protein
MRTPDFYIVGAPKCGTTAMYRWLLAHPDIFLPAKEIHFYGQDLDHRRPPMSRDEYQALYSNATPQHGVLGDVAVWHLMSETAAEEISSVSPEAKIIIMLRRPDEMLYSLHSQLVYSGEEPILDFGQALAAEPDRAEGRRVPPSTHSGLEAPPSESLQYRRVARFDAQVARYQALFSDVLVLLHDDLRADQAATYQRVLDFLGVDPGFSPDFSVVNPNTTVKSHAARRAIQSMRWGPVRALTPAPLRGIGRRVMERLQSMNTQTAARPPLCPEIAASLRAELRSDVLGLSDRIGRDLSHWLEAPAG